MPLRTPSHHRSLHPCRAAWVWLVAGCLLAGPAAGSIYTCVDASGRRLSSDRPIPECRDRVQHEIGPSGTVRRVIAPPPTPEEQERAAAQQRAAAEAAAREAAQRRHESLLLARYPDEASHQRARAEALARVQAVIDSAQQHAQALEQERQRLDEEMASQRKDPAKAPPALKQRLAANAQQRQLQAQFIADQEREKARIEARFDAERDTLRRLWAGASATPSAAPR